MLFTLLVLTSIIHYDFGIFCIELFDIRSHEDYTSFAGLFGHLSVLFIVCPVSGILVF